LRGLRIAVSRQLRLDLGAQTGTGRWDTLPETTQVSVLALLARLIARGVTSGEEVIDD
jgi:hypothetical protein